jgi:hypothetical protein
MKQAGLSMIKEKNLLSKRKIEWLESLEKQKRNIEIGLICRENEDILDGIETGINEFINLFLKENSLSLDDVVSIKRDAVFSTKPCEKKIFGNIEFRLNEKYSSFFNLNRVEFYYSDWRKKLTVKGISQDKLVLHENYFLKLVINLLKMMETNDERLSLPFLQNFQRKYLSKELDIEYYRELTNDSLYSIIIGGKIFQTPFYKDKEDIFIGYNYNRYLLPLIKIFLLK